MPYWTVIKYKLKDIFEDEFLKQAEGLENQICEDAHPLVWLKTT